jgi:hypothetical protein
MITAGYGNEIPACSMLYKRVNALSLAERRPVMKRILNVLLIVLVALTLTACAAATNPVLDHGAPIGAVSEGP